MLFCPAEVPPGRYMSQGLVRWCPQGFYRENYTNFDAAVSQICLACKPGITTQVRQLPVWVCRQLEHVLQQPFRYCYCPYTCVRAVQLQKCSDLRTAAKGNFSSCLPCSTCICCCLCCCRALGQSWRLTATWFCPATAYKPSPTSPAQARPRPCPQTQQGASLRRPCVA